MTLAAELSRTQAAKVNDLLRSRQDDATLLMQMVQLAAQDEIARQLDETLQLDSETQRDAQIMLLHQIPQSGQSDNFLHLLSRLHEMHAKQGVEWRRECVSRVLQTACVPYFHAIQDVLNGGGDGDSLWLDVQGSELSSLPYLSHEFVEQVSAIKLLGGMVASRCVHHQAVKKYTLKNVDKLIERVAKEWHRLQK